MDHELSMKLKISYRVYRMNHYHYLQQVSNPKNQLLLQLVYH